MFQEHHLRVPGRNRFGNLAWKPPTISAITSVLKNPAYAGACVSGRARPTRHAAAPIQARPQQLPREAWTLRGNDTSPAAIPWETAVRIRTRLQDHDAAYDRHKTRGVPRAGAALLHGLRSGGACGQQSMGQ